MEYKFVFLLILGIYIICLYMFFYFYGFLVFVYVIVENFVDLQLYFILKKMIIDYILFMIKIMLVNLEYEDINNNIFIKYNVYFLVEDLESGV